jgi:hypothetical protein
VDCHEYRLDRNSKDGRNAKIPEALRSRSVLNGRTLRLGAGFFSYDFIAFLLVLSIGTILYLLVIDDNPPAEIIEVSLYDKDFNMPIENVTVVPGDTIQYSIYWCKYTDAPAKIRRTWVNEIVDSQPLVQPAVVKAGCRHTNIDAKIPDTLRPSVYDLVVTFEYQVNPLMVRDVTFRVPNITIVEPD